MTIRHKAFPLITLLAFFVCAQFVGQAFSAPITINNPSFEEDVLASEGDYVYSVSGWALGAWDVSTLRPTTGTLGMFPSGVPDGVNCVSLNNNGEISQTLSANLEIGTYILKVWIGYRNDLYLSAYDIELLAGGNLLNNNSSPIPLQGTFEERTVSYTVNPGDPYLGQPLGIRFGFNAVDNFTLPQQASFDHVSLNFIPSNVTPIPSNFFLLGSGLIGLLSWRRYKKN